MKWKKLTPDDFESLCTHLLYGQGFRNVRKIGGTGDRGRDIVAERNHHILGPTMRTESWIAICKRYLTKPPSITDLESDIAWCGAHRPHGVFIFTPLNLTPATHDWIEIKRKNLHFDVVVLDKDFLEHTLHRDPSLHERFFGATKATAEGYPIFYERIEKARRYDVAIYTAGKMAEDPIRHAMAPWRAALAKEVDHAGMEVDLLHPEFVGCDHGGIAASSTVELDSYMIGQSDAMLIYLSEDGMYATVAEAMIAHAQQIPVEFFIHESILVSVPEGRGMMDDIYKKIYKTRHGCSCLVFMDNYAETVDVNGLDPLVRTEYWWLLTLFRESRRNVSFHIVHDDNWLDRMCESIQSLIDA